MLFLISEESMYIQPLYKGKMPVHSTVLYSTVLRIYICMCVCVFCSYSVGASWKDDHIYDTVILAKPSMGSPSNSRYTSQPRRSDNAAAAEYEVPVTRHSGNARETNGHPSNQQQQSSVNPVYLELCTGPSPGNSVTINTS